MAQTGSRNDPYTSFNFIVEVDGLDAQAVAGFQEASGLVSESTVIEYRVGTEDIVVRKLPGLLKFPNLVLKRGFTDNRGLWEWRKTVVEGRTVRYNGSITMLNEAREPALRFEFREGWPVKWEGPSLSALREGIAIETLEIAHKGLVLGE